MNQSIQNLVVNRKISVLNYELYKSQLKNFNWLVFFFCFAVYISVLGPYLVPCCVFNAILVVWMHPTVEYFPVRCLDTVSWRTLCPSNSFRCLLRVFRTGALSPSWVEQGVIFVPFCFLVDFFFTCMQMYLVRVRFSCSRESACVSAFLVRS